MNVYATYTDPDTEEAAHVAHIKAQNKGWSFGRPYAFVEVDDDDHADEAVQELRALGFTINDHFTE